ncbi:La-related protein 7 [Balamuthia mandrillaris]
MDGGDGVEAKVREQVEFYLSDSNLNKDKFLRPLVEGDPSGFVDISVLANFNKISSLTKDHELIVRSLKASKKLKVDKEGKRVKRKLPFQTYDETPRTVYAENLPNGFNHETLKQLFETVGNVAYVSLPRFQQTRQFKGFAFVEYEQEADANKAVQQLNAFHPTNNPKGLRVVLKSAWADMREKFEQQKQAQQDSSSNKPTPGQEKKRKREDEKKEADKQKETESDEEKEKEKEKEETKEEPKKKKRKKETTESNGSKLDKKKVKKAAKKDLKKEKKQKKKQKEEEKKEEKKDKKKKKKQHKGEEKQEKADKKKQKKKKKKVAE